MDAKSLPAVNAAIEKLMDQLIRAQLDLRRAESISGKGWSPRRCTAIRERIASIKKRLERAERLQEQLLCCPN